jgi:LPPG:FO 2-phospho-L-lactate transferase
MLQRYGYQTWFNLGDRDLATHLHRTEQLLQGKTLSAVTSGIVSSLGLDVRLLPSSDDMLQTYVSSGGRSMHFQEYMVRFQTKPRIKNVFFKGVGSAKPAPKVIQSITEADGVAISPSNPIVSIGAVLAVNGIRSALRKTGARVVGVSPIVGGMTVKGPADKLMKALGIECSAVGVAALYKDFLDTLIIDRVDRKLAPRIRALGIKTVVTQTLMKTMGDKVRLARIVVSEFKN